MSSFPDWVLQHKGPGREVKRIKNRYYLYEITSKWNKAKKRTQKITVKMLGSISESGLRPVKQPAPKVPQLPRLPDCSAIAVKEYGVSYLVGQYVGDLASKLQSFYPEHWQMLLGVVYCRLLSQAPISQMPLLFAHSYLSESYAGPQMNDKNISLSLRDIGRDRGTAVSFMRSFVGKGQHLLFDLTHVPSQSQAMDLAAQGPDAKGGIGSQINLLYLFSVERQEPVYYRFLPGNIRDVSALALSIEESGARESTLIADKGFYSAHNANALEKAGLKFIMPLKRDSKLIEAHRLTEENIKTMDNYFTFENRVIWHASYPLPQKGRTLFLFVDSSLKTQEEKDYLARIGGKKSKYSVQAFHKKKHFFGLIALLTNKPDQKASEVYCAYKNRNQIELMFDSLKNILDADKTYMQNEETLQGWMFANHLALIIYYRLYQLLQRKEELAKYSVHSLITHLSLVKKVKINEQWHLAEITKKSIELFQKLEIPVT
jgi:Transposase DDE domain